MKTLILALLCFSPILASTIQKRSENKINGRIIGGAAANTAEFPFVAAIYTTKSLGRYFCGGAILDRQWILTAGHCVQDAVSFSIQLGSNSLRDSDSNREIITATSSVLHPDFDPETLENNIGLIQLPASLLLNDFINVIALPTATVADDTIGITVGWGQTDDDTSGPVNSLNKVEVVTLANEHCQYTYGPQITQEMVCANGGYNQGLCIGDIGGPLIEYINDQPVHIGVASFISGNGCESEDPSGYIRTFNYLDWIKSVTNIA